MERLTERVIELEDKMKDFETMKEKFGEALKAKLATMEAVSQGHLDSVVSHARAEFEQMKLNLLKSTVRRTSSF